MNYLEKLLDGAEVEWKPLGDILVRTKGTQITAGKMKQLHKEGAPLKVFAWGKTVAYVNFEDIPAKDINHKPSIIVKSRGNIEFEYYDKPFSHKNEMWSYHSNGDSIKIKYVYHFLKFNVRYFQGLCSGKPIPQITTQDTDKFPIPIPCPNDPERSLAIQAEIVRILDAFTSLVTIATDLTAEIELRKKQYEYYRDKLLNTPKPVEWKPLGEIAELVRGNGMPKADFVDTGVGCIHYGQIYTYYGTWTTETKSFIAPEKAARLTKVDPGDLIIANASENIEDVCKAVAWLGDTQIVTGGHATVIKHKQNPKYLAYYLQTAQFFADKKKHATGTRVFDVSAKSLAKIKIPIPPLEIQEEIVRSLDAFAGLPLAAELTAEIDLRQKQYEYYRNLLLTFDKNKVKLLPLGQKGVGEFIRGSGLQKKDFTETGVGCIHYGQIYTHYGTYADKTETFVSKEFAKKSRKARTGDLVIATTSQSGQDICKAVAWLGNEDIAVSSDACIYRHNLNPKYVSYFFQTEQFQKQKRQYITGTQVQRVNVDDLSKILIPIPSMEEQERIVSILDKFDECTLVTTLMAEIELRKKQYKHYRDKLLDEWPLPK